MPVALSAQAAAHLGVSAGKVLTLRSPYDRKDATLRVSGILRPDDPASPYWHLDPLNGRGILQAGGFTTYGPLFTSAAMMRTGRDRERGLIAGRRQDRVRAVHSGTAARLSEYGPCRRS